MVERAIRAKDSESGGARVVITGGTEVAAAVGVIKDRAWGYPLPLSDCGLVG